MAEENSAASSGLFAVFLLSIYSLFLIPYTIYRLCSAGDEVTTQPVVKVRARCCWLHAAAACAVTLPTLCAAGSPPAHCTATLCRGAVVPAEQEAASVFRQTEGTVHQT